MCRFESELYRLATEWIRLGQHWHNFVVVLVPICNDRFHGAHLSTDFLFSFPNGKPHALLSWHERVPHITSTHVGLTALNVHLCFSLELSYSNLLMQLMMLPIRHPYNFWRYRLNCRKVANYGNAYKIGVGVATKYPHKIEGLGSLWAKWGSDTCRSPHLNSPCTICRQCPSWQDKGCIMSSISQRSRMYFHTWFDFMPISFISTSSVFSFVSSSHTA